MSLCPWCLEDVAITSTRRARRGGRLTSRSFTAHVQRCPDAPESVKAAYRVPLYPPGGC